MKNKNLVLILSSAILFLVVLQINFISAAAQTTVCAQHTIYGAWCQDVPISEVDTNYAYSQTSCQSTSYCSMGTCVNSQTGTCLASPQATCSSSQGGTWYSSVPSATPVCQLGCCFVGDQASYTTKATCNSFSTSYGVNTTFDKSITNEFDCISSAQPLAKGACVYDAGNGRTCKFTTRQDCKKINSATFKQDYLCTNPDLGTNCAMITQTTCLKEKDQVYYLDSCGNTANVYDHNKVTDVQYWSYIAGTNGVTVDTVDGQGNIESSTNGNCNYYLGSTCRQYSSSLDSNKPTDGTNICRSVNCDSGTFAEAFALSDLGGDSRTPKNGESWCGSETTDNSGNLILQVGSGNSGASTSDDTFSTYTKAGNTPGSIDVLFVCANGQITTQISAQYRQKICIQSKTSNGYLSAGLIVNRWQDCWTQNGSIGCLDDSTRDCLWVEGASVIKDSSGNPMVYDSSQDTLVSNSGNGDSRSGYSCVPKYPPGFDTSTSNTCGTSSITCIVNFSKGALGGWAVDSPDKIPASIKCMDDDETVVSDFGTNYDHLCKAMGDCGVSVNYINVNGANTNIIKVIKGNTSGANL